MKKLFVLLVLSQLLSFSLSAQNTLLVGMGNYINPAYHPIGADNSFHLGTGLKPGFSNFPSNMGVAFASTLGNYQVGVNVWNQNFVANNSEYNLSISRKILFGSSSWISTGLSASYINRSYDVYRLPYRSYTLSGGFVYGHGNHRVGLSANNFIVSSASMALQDEPMYLSFIYLNTFVLGAFELQPYTLLRMEMRNNEGHNPTVIGFTDYNQVNVIGLNTKFRGVKAGINFNQLSSFGYNAGYDFKSVSINYGYQGVLNPTHTGDISMHYCTLRFSPKGFTTGMQMF